MIKVDGHEVAAGAAWHHAVTVAGCAGLADLLIAEDGHHDDGALTVAGRAADE